MKHLILPAIALVSGVFATVAVARMRPERQTTNPPTDPPIASYADTVAAVGLVEPATESIAVGTPLPGVVAEVLVAAGREVAAGDALFRLETRHLEADAAVRRARIQAARARLATATSVLEDVEDRTRRAEVLRRDTVISEDELARQRFGLATARARMEEARTDIAAEEAGLRATEVEIARSTVAAPTNATVLKVDVRPGEYVAAGVVARPPMILGGLTPLHVRADIDEHEGVRVRAGAAAEARPRGDPSRRFRLAFVRFEPFVIPKRSLTGDATERVDTRVLQAIYRIEGDVAGMYVGQQLDIFIEAARPVAAR